jgi:cell wall-associated NlpC family hydrolase
MPLTSLKNRPLITAAALLLATLCLLLTTMLLTSIPANADPNLSDKQDEIDRIKAEVAGINQSAAQAVERYNQANVELEETRKQLIANEAALAEATANLAESQGILETRVDRIYRQGSSSFVEVLFSTSSFNEFMSQYDLLGRIGDQDKEVVEQVFAYKSEVEETRTGLEQAQQKQQELVDTLAVEKNEIEAQLAARQEVLAGAEDEVAQILAEEERQSQQAEAAYTSQAVSQIDSGTPAPPSAELPSEPDQSAPAPPPPSSGGAVSIAMQYLGVPYVWGGSSPGGFDCSGLVMYVYAQMGVSLPHSAAGQYYSGTPVSYSQLAPGDLVFFGQPIYHVGIYIGGGSMIHAPFEGAVVSIAGVSNVGSYSGACRI